MTTIHEIAPDVYRIGPYVPDHDMQFNHFLIKDDEPMLYHTGMRLMFPMLKEAVSSLIDLKKLRWVGQSSPLHDYLPYTHKTKGMLQQQADLNPATLAIMHGSSYQGDCANALQELDGIMKEQLGPGGHLQQ